ncbi:tetratricopeptide repeat protein [Flavobacterium urocaniciphilum]|uniref:Tetratricopeptide repeat-containing protein n=1 Tax=Flavobacterium urocaniciphilum TaxID=1299341 RepID=A0A1H9CPP9_9FLAO|nr:tetratricopeptide repeat protein [Flavobacterium urocaniciphilum]SEQ03037.1 Tetratricopeptide repeat-containing protein [Flavobacterium urocaniciphilum]
MIGVYLHKKIVVFTLTIFIALGSSFFANAQRNKAFDKRIKDGTLMMYDDPDAAIRIGNQVVKDAKDNVDYKIRAFKLISDAYSSKRDYEKSLEYVIKANQLLHLTKDDLLKILIVNKMGIQYHQLKIYDKSIQYLDQAEQLMLNHPVKDSILYYLGSNYVVRGFIYKEKLNCNIAIEYFDKGVSKLIASKSKLAFSAISIAKYNKGNCYLLLEDNPKAKENFLLAISYAKKVNAKSLHAFALKGLAQVFTFDGKYNEAVNSLQEAITISKNVNDLILNQEIYKGLSDNYLALNNWDKYKEFHFKYLSTRKLIKERERKTISDSLLEKKSELKDKYDESINKFYFVYIFIIILIIGVILFVLHRIKRSKKDIELLQNKINLLQNPKNV